MTSVSRVRSITGRFGFKALFKAFWGRILTTWAILIVENILIALVPLLIGLTIDGLLSKRFDEFLLMLMTLIALCFIAVARRIYDTRAYGGIRVYLGSVVEHAHSGVEVSTRNIRLDLSRELVDFLENEVPELITSVIQIAISLIVLALFHLWLGLSSLIVIAGMLFVYSLFHGRFYKLNGDLNSQRERQINILNTGTRVGLFRHLRALRETEVSLSDTEAIVYGSIFLLQIFYIAFNLYIGASLPDISPGRIFSIATYSWEYAEAAIALPMALQSWSRLREITQRINSRM
ncbi:MAG: ABC transporter six-transmembrane domain-containing protein [Sneathiella sp.]